MTQRKPTDKVIKKKAKELATHPVMGHDSDKENKILKGLRWARDYDPWYYVSDGELPKLEEDKNGIVKSDWNHVVKCVDGEWDFAALYKRSSGKYNWEFMNIHIFEDGEADCGDLDKVICFMPIPQPQK